MQSEELNKCLCGHFHPEIRWTFVCKTFAIHVKMDFPKMQDTCTIIREES